jgi:uncharacterized protein YndB with AHSA1/START domain
LGAVSTQRQRQHSTLVVYVTYIRIPPEKLWHALITPEIIRQYRFGMSVESEWRMYADGSLMDSGEILESISQKRLVMSWLNDTKSG